MNPTMEPTERDPCIDLVCPEVVCNDGSEPPIRPGQCCGELSLCESNVS